MSFGAKRRIWPTKNASPFASLRVKRSRRGGAKAPPRADLKVGPYEGKGRDYSMPDFVTVARTDEVPPGEMKVVEVAGEEVVVANVDGTYYAFGNECTHVGGPLSEGALQGDQVPCPWHSTIFDVKTGQPQGGPGKDPVPTYQVRVQCGEVQVAPRD